MAVQVLDENGIVRTLPEVSEVGARIDEKVQANMPEDGADGKDGLSIWETTTNTTTGTTSIAISTLNKVAGRSVQVGDYIIGNATYSYLYLVTAVNSTTVTVTYRRTLRGATGSGGSVTVDSELSETSENPVQNKVINKELKEIKACLSALELGIKKVKIYGVDKVGSSNPSALVRTDDAVGLGYTVGASEIVSDFDRCYPWSDMQEVTDASGNVFIKIPKFYAKITQNADGTFKHQISGVRYDGFTTLFIDGAGNELDYILVGKYEGSGSASRVYSKSGQTVLVDITLDNFRTRCKANGNGYQQYDFLIDLIIKELWLVEMKTTNSQSVMYGYANENSAAITTGRTDTVKTPSGSEVSNTDGKHACKYRGIENLWGNVYKWVDGISFSENKVYVCTDPASYVAAKTASPYVYHGDRPLSGGTIKTVAPLGQHPLIQYATEDSGASATTYYCDWHYNYGGTVLCVGGNWIDTTKAGLWFWAGNNSASGAYSYVGGRLCYKPL